MALTMSTPLIRMFILAFCAAAGSDSLLESAQSLPVSTYCVSADQCAALCRRFVEGDRQPEDFIRQAAFELGPPDSFRLPPSNASIPVTRWAATTRSIPTGCSSPSRCFWR